MPHSIYKPNRENDVSKWLRHLSFKQKSRQNEQMKTVKKGQNLDKNQVRGPNITPSSTYNFKK